MRENPATTLGKYKVVEFRDYKKDIIKNNATGEITKTGLPNSNVLYYGLENDAWCCVRPSGTEPKIKFYMGVKGKTEEEAEQELKELTKVMEVKAVNEDSKEKLKEAKEKRKSTMKDLYGSTNGNCNSEEAIEKGRNTKYLKHITNFPDLKIIVELIKDNEIVWSGEKYHLLVFLYGYESAIKSKHSLVNKLDTNKTWKSNSKWNGYTIRTKKLN
jgi:hypothetical protein